MNHYATWTLGVTQANTARACSWKQEMTVISHEMLAYPTCVCLHQKSLALEGSEFILCIALFLLFSEFYLLLHMLGDARGDC